MLLLPQFELATFLLIGATCAFVEITSALFPLKPSIDCWYVFILCRTILFYLVVNQCVYRL